MTMVSQLEDDCRRVLQLARAEGRANKNKEAKRLKVDKLQRHRHERSQEGRHTLCTAKLQGLFAIDRLDSNTRHIGDCSRKSVSYHRNDELLEENDEVLQQRLDARRSLYKRHFAGTLANASGQKREKEHVLEAAARAARSCRATGVGIGIGAAVLTDSQTLYSASAIEKGALLLCAERAVIMKMVTSHASSVILAMAICSEQRAFLPFPCGGCRELLADCGDFPLYLVNAIGEIEETTSTALFPRARHFEMTQMRVQPQPLKAQTPPAASTLTDQPPLEVKDWTTQDVLEWLESDVDLSQYRHVFERNQIDGCTLVLLEGSDLQLLLGITHPVHRAKLLTSIDRLRDRELLARGLDYTQLEDYLAVLDSDRVSAVAHLKSTFDRLDANHDGFLDFTQVKQALTRLRCTTPALCSKNDSVAASPQAVERLLHSEELFGLEAANTGNVSFPAFARAFAKLAMQGADTSTITQGAFAVHAFGPRLVVLDLKKLRQSFDEQFQNETLDEAGLVRLLQELGQSEAQSTELACRWLDAQETNKEPSDRMEFAHFITRYAQFIEVTAGVEATSVLRLQELFRSYAPVQSTLLKPRSVVYRALTTLFPAVPSDEVKVWCAAHWPSKKSNKDGTTPSRSSTTLTFSEFTLACLQFAADVDAWDQEVALIKRSMRNDALVHRSRVVHLHSSGHVRMCPHSEEQKKYKRDSTINHEVARDKAFRRQSYLDDEDEGKRAEREGKAQDSENDEDTRTRREQQVDESFDRFTRRHRSKTPVKEDSKANSEDGDACEMLNAVEAAQAALELGAALSREQVLRYHEREGLGQLRHRDISRAAFHRLMKRLDANQNRPRDLLLDIDTAPRQQRKTLASQAKTTGKSPQSQTHKSKTDYDEFLRQKRARCTGIEWKEQVNAFRQKQRNQQERQAVKKSKKFHKLRHTRDSEDGEKKKSVRKLTDSSDSEGKNPARRLHHRYHHSPSHQSRHSRQKQKLQRYPHRKHSSSSSVTSSETEASFSKKKSRSLASPYGRFKRGRRVASMVHGRGTIERLYRDYFIADVHFDSGRHVRNVELSGLRVLDLEDKVQSGSEWSVGSRVRLAREGTKTPRQGKIVLCRTDGTFDILVNEFRCPKTLKRIARNALTLVDKKPIVYQVGARVLVRQRSEYLRGTVGCCRTDGTYDVKLLKSPHRVLKGLASELLALDIDEDGYSDDEGGTNHTQDSKEEFESEFSRGDRIEARFQGHATYFRGTIECVHPNGLYDISYDDGDEEQRVTPDMIRPLQKSEAGKQRLEKTSDDAYESDLFDSDC